MTSIKSPKPFFYSNSNKDTSFVTSPFEFHVHTFIKLGNLLNYNFFPTPINYDDIPLNAVNTKFNQSPESSLKIYPLVDFHLKPLNLSLFCCSAREIVREPHT